MSRDYNDLDLESILSEFSGDSSADSEPKLPEPSRTEPRREVKTADAAPSAQRTRTLPGLSIGALGYVVLSVVAILCLWWSVMHLHPDTELADTELSAFDLSSRISMFVNNAASDALSDVVVLRKIYTIPETDLVAPKPDAAAFGETDDVEVIQALIDRSAELLEGQELCWSADIERYPGSKMQYYCDDSILVITWKELKRDAVLTFAEIKIADGSQLRRALAGNSYGSGVRMKATDMAQSVNAVVAINGDFYDYRRLGITAYQRKLYRNEPALVDSAFFTASGDMLMTHMGELGGSATQDFITDNDVIFAIAFGPILVENGEAQKIYSYPVGEIDAWYSRSVIAQKDELHYVLMNVGEQDEHKSRATINQTAQYIAEKGVQSAYTLDGGQTAVIAMNGETVNRVDWGNERTMSDIIYFATAIPEGEVGK